SCSSCSSWFKSSLRRVSSPPAKLAELVFEASDAAQDRGPILIGARPHALCTHIEVPVVEVFEQVRGDVLFRGADLLEEPIEPAVEDLFAHRDDLHDLDEVIRDRRGLVLL